MELLAAVADFCDLRLLSFLVGELLSTRSSCMWDLQIEPNDLHLQPRHPSGLPPKEWQEAIARALN